MAHSKLICLMVKLGFIVATNNDEILQRNFLKSKVISDQKYPVTLQRGYRNIGKAYNDGMAGTDSQFLVCLHQDVFLPDHWEDQLMASLHKLAATRWGVLGVAGVNLVGGRREFLGHLLDRGMAFGPSAHLPAQVETLDELLLVIRNDGKLLFDEDLPTAHFYGADVCLRASSQGLGCFAIDAYCHHNSTNSNIHSREFRMAVKYMRKKWKHRLPFGTTCTIVESRFLDDLRRAIWSFGCQPQTHPGAAKLRRFLKLLLGRK